jgi:hypothetical protein
MNAWVRGDASAHNDRQPSNKDFWNFLAGLHTE